MSAERSRVIHADGDTVLDVTCSLRLDRMRSSERSAILGATCFRRQEGGSIAGRARVCVCVCAAFVLVAATLL